MKRPKARKEAERFQAALDGQPADAESQRLARLAFQMQETPTVEISPDFQRELRSGIQQQASTALLEPPAGRSPETRELINPAPSGPAPRLKHRAQVRKQRWVTALAAVAIALGISGVAIAAEAATPGSPLYGVKRGIEGLASATSVSADQRVHSHLNSARSRLSEASQMSEAGDLSYLRENLASYSSELSAAATLILDDAGANKRGEHVAALQDFASEAVILLAQLETELPRSTPRGDARAIHQAQGLTSQISNAAATGCASCLAVSPRPGASGLNSSRATGPATTQTRRSQGIENARATTAAWSRSPSTPTTDNDPPELATTRQQRSPFTSQLATGATEPGPSKPAPAPSGSKDRDNRSRPSYDAPTIPPMKTIQTVQELSN